MKGAKIIYEKILSVQPENFDTLHLLGALLAQIKNYSEAVKYLSKALKINSDDARTHCNLGIVFKELNQLDEALVCYDKAIELEPKYGDAFNNRGIVLKELKRLDEALINYNQAIQIEPNYPQAHYNRGLILQELKRLDEALVAYDKAIAINPSYVNAFNNRGIVLKELKRLDEALVNYNQLITINPDYAQGHYNKGKALQELMRYDEALISYNQAIEINPSYVDAYNNIGNIFQELMQLDKSLVNYNRAIAIQLDYADAYFNKSLLLLLTNNYLEGWRLYEWRWKQEHNISLIRKYKQQLWLGIEPLNNKTLLIYFEQGFGDYIQFIRYALLVENLGAKVILDVPLVLLSLISTLKGQFIFIESGKSLPSFDYHCPVMSLPLAFKTTINSIPNQIPYLYANKEKETQWHKRLAKKTNSRIGLVWSGSPRHDNDYNRSLLLTQLSDLLSSPYEFHSLQKEMRETDTEKIIDFPNLYQHQDELKDFSDTAALINSMDLIISVDTSIAHLAGSMNKAVWILLPFRPDFRWLLDRKDSPWYPSARLYRQEKLHDWDSVLKKIKTDLLKIKN